MLVGDKKGMQVPSETSLGERVIHQDQRRNRVNSRGQSPRINPTSAEQIPNQQSEAPSHPARQQESRRHAKLLSQSKRMVFATQTPFNSRLFILLMKQIHSSKVRQQGPVDGKWSWSFQSWFQWQSYLGNCQGGGIWVQAGRAPKKVGASPQL